MELEHAGESEDLGGKTLADVICRTDFHTFLLKLSIHHDEPFTSAEIQISQLQIFDQSEYLSDTTQEKSCTWKVFWVQAVRAPKPDLQ